MRRLSLAALPHDQIIATLELIEAHVHAQGQAAQFTYHGMLGGDDASVSIGKGVELVTRRIAGRSELAAFAESTDAIDAALAALDGLEISLDDRLAVLAAFRGALLATRDRWPALEREFPEPAFAELQVDHPRAHGMLGHTIDPLTGDIRPAYAAARRGKHPLFAWWSAARGFHVPVTPARAMTTTTSSSPCDWLDVSGCDLPCELMQCVDVISLPDCDIGCDPGCL